jgi:hypothetical protein
MTTCAGVGAGAPAADKDAPIPLWFDSLSIANVGFAPKVSATARPADGSVCPPALVPAASAAARATRSGRMWAVLLTAGASAPNCRQTVSGHARTERSADAAHGLLDPLLVLDEREPDMALAGRAEPDARADRDLRLA